MPRYSRRKIESLKTNPEIVCNRLKIEAAVNNTRIYLDILETEGSFSNYIWQFVEGIPQQNQWRSLEEIPVTTAESSVMSKALKKRDFKFVGSISYYAYMQAVGMVNDHTTQCFRYEPIRSIAT
jgi:DNA-3-methyladenine glycosylase I